MSLHKNPAAKLETRRINQLGLILAVGIFLILTFLYHIKVPLFEKPDELKHFAVVQYIQTHRALPVVRGGIYKAWDQEGTQPPLYHLMAAVATSNLDLADFEELPRNPHYADNRSFVWRQQGNNNLYLHRPDELWSAEPTFAAAWISRLVSMLAGATTIVLTYWLARIIFVNSEFAPLGKNENYRFTTASRIIIERIPLLAVALLAAVPQYLHVSSAITNDSLAITLSAATLVTLALILRDGTSLRIAIILGLLLGLGAITKLSLLYLLPLTAIVLLSDFYRHRNFEEILSHTLIISGLTIILAGWWYWRNWDIYGDPTALNAHLLYRGGALDPTPALRQIWKTELVGLELSFWAAFGAGQVLLEPWLYDLLRWLKYLIFAGVLIGFFRLIRSQLTRSRIPPCNGTDPKFPVQVLSLSLLLLWTLVIFVALLRWMQITPASWGRLLYPALPAMAVLSAWGLSQFALLATRISYENRGLKRHILSLTRLLLLSFPWVIVLTLATLSVVSPFRTLSAAYEQTPLITEADIPVDVQPVNLYFGDEALRLVAYRVDQDEVHPGDWLKMTIFWQATRPISKNYSTFVHLLTPEGNSIAQTNTYPDGGRWPTSILPAGKVLPAVYYVPVPADVAAPMATRLAAGIFEFDDPQRTAKAAVTSAGEPAEAIFDGVPVTPREWPAPQPAEQVTVVFDQKIKLIGIDSINSPVKHGTPVPLTLYWKTLAAPDQDLNLFIHLVDPTTGEQIAGFDAPPSFPTRYWQPGAIIIDRRVLDFPTDLPPGNYQILIGWYSLDDFSRLPLEADPNGHSAFPLITIEVE